ncbi:voltage-gated potassium channel [Wolfiporia cocos MD-104 SS10]|uniref:Voltage-gated potassium channel n=1 Tax=Wolfiporia cocos (strain MD-104) TaxID=742152 RepID=A0A2H3JDG1_WOLCO|nr:voltage-gated potassium channel [Wolfiporia cocos MD-104 SS10]
MSDSIPLARLRSPVASSSQPRYVPVSPTPDSPGREVFPHVTSFESMDDAHVNEIHPLWRRHVYMLLERPTSSQSAFIIHVVTTSLIVISAVVTVLETIPSFHSIPPQVWFGLETALVVLFTVEYIARCVAHSAGLWTFLRWFGSFFGIIDLLGILPYYIETALRQDTSVFFRFTILRTFRLLRVFRPFRYNNTILLTIEVMYLSFRRSQHALLALSFFVAMVLVVFSTLLYFAERGTWDEVLGTFINSDGDPSQFASIPAAGWFVIVTITTVGYGEITPRSFLGRLITLPLLVFGLLLIALPTFVLGREFSMVWEMMKEDQVLRDEVFNASVPDPLSSPVLLARQRSLSMQSAGMWRNGRDEGRISNDQHPEVRDLRSQITELKATVETQGVLLQRLCTKRESNSRRVEIKWQRPRNLNDCEVEAMPPKRHSDRAHKVYQPGRRHFELIPSVSRSSGLDKDGDALREPKVQEEYRDFIQRKLEDYWKRYPDWLSHAEVQRHGEAEQENILILFRKLREGLLSTKRSDAFAIEVYQTSLHLSILFRSPNQTTSILSHLLPLLFATKPSTASETVHSALPTTVLSLAHNLLVGYPSQSRYYEQLHSLPQAFFSRDSDAYRWLEDLARCTRTRNYARLDALTRRTAFEHLISRDEAMRSSGADDSATSAKGGSPTNMKPKPDLALEALCSLVEQLRGKARATSWLVIRSAYRELHCPPPTAPDLAEAGGGTLAVPATTEWLSHSLTLTPMSSVPPSTATIAKLVDDWLARKCEEGEVKRKEGTGMEGRWIVCKVPVKA